MSLLIKNKSAIDIINKKKWVLKSIPVEHQSCVLPCEPTLVLCFLIEISDLYRNLKPLILLLVKREVCSQKLRRGQ